MIHSRDYVPAVYAESRDYQVILTLLDLIINAVKSDADNFITLLNPRLCKRDMLPHLASYVGYKYDYKESVAANRMIIENYPYLIRNRGSEIGISLATALSVNVAGELEDIEMLKMFHIEYVSELDRYGEETGRIRIYVYYPNYLSKIRDLIEVVRPAGVIVELVPAIPINASEKIILTDEFRIFKYNYITGKIISIDNHQIIINDSKEIIINKKPTEYSIDGNKILESGEDTGYRLEEIPTDKNKPKRYKVLNPDGSDSSYTIENGKIYLLDSDTNYMLIGNEIFGYNIPSGYYLSDGRIYNKSNEDTGYYVNDSNYIEKDDGSITDYFISEIRIMKHEDSEDHYTGAYIDVKKSGKILDTYYEIKSDGNRSGFYYSNDTGLILNDSDSSTRTASLINISFSNPNQYLMVGEDKLIYLVDVQRDNDGKISYIDSENKEPTGWRVDPSKNNRFYNDTTGELSPYYIGKKRFIVDHEYGKSLLATKYFLNKYEDIVDNVGNTVLSKIDRYKISDSNMIGFGEVADDINMRVTYDSTEILKRYYLYASEDVFVAEDQILDVRKDEPEDFND